jgi:hypothetical protein
MYYIVMRNLEWHNGAQNIVPFRPLPAKVLCKPLDKTLTLGGSVKVLFKGLAKNIWPAGLAGDRSGPPTSTSITCAKIVNILTPMNIGLVMKPRNTIY